MLTVVILGNVQEPPREALCGNGSIRISVIVVHHHLNKTEAF